MEDNNSLQDESQQFSGALGTIYKITNTLNGKLYVGQTRQSFKRRITEHKRNRKRTKLKKLAIKL